MEKPASPTSEKFDASAYPEKEKNIETDSAYSGKSWSISSVLEKKLVRRLDLWIIPLLGILKMLHGYERTVITSAKLGGLLEDLKMSDSQYLWCLSIFYVGYILLNVPCNIIIRRWKPSIFLALVTLSWGIIAMSTAAVHNFAGLFMARFMMGVAEAGNCVAGATGGLIGFGISQMSTDKLNTWQWMFIIEGAPCVVFAAITYYFLPDSHKDAKFLTEEQKLLEQKRMEIDEGAAGTFTWSWEQVKSVFLDWKVIFYFVIHITGSIGGAGISLTLPSLIAGMGAWSPAVSLALTTPPYALSCIFILIACWTSDRFFDRSYHITLGNIFAAVGFLILMFAPYEAIAARYFAVCIALAGNYMIFPIKIAWYSNNFSGLTRRAIATGIVSSIDSIGSAFGSQIFHDPPHYFWGSTIGFICIGVQIVATLALRFFLWRENKKRDKMTPEEKQAVIDSYDPELIGDRHPDFRYAL
ncbi:major facilitator superfamily domain-containing protein [Fennellomyces sp. T-0311]|nr:major facilitator superfamily domain-containing protein [Fennellomyces sp. T-0311]